MESKREPKPFYTGIDDGEDYSANLMTEYAQSTEEGLNLEPYRETFEAVSRLPKGEIRGRLGDVLFQAVLHAEPAAGYRYTEPSDPDGIRALRRPYALPACKPDPARFTDKLHGAWMGRICGCLLGKTVEGIRTNELHPFLEETGNRPMRRYILRSDLTDAICGKYRYPFAGAPYADAVDGMPVDDDTNYTVLAQQIVAKYGRNFTSRDVAEAWLAYQPKNAYFTAERVTFCNLIRGYAPPDSARYQNPFREWIGAQIRTDYYGYINPGDPECAADMAFRDACISHVKNGIYGAMFAAAMLACAAVTDRIEDVILGGLAQIPATSRLYEAVSGVLADFEKGVPQDACFDGIHARFDEYTAHGWCHTIPNAMIVAASLLYGKGDYGKSVCMAVETGFDTDCNGATVGSVLGMLLGIGGIGTAWTAPIRDMLHTSLFGVGTVSVSDCVQKTLSHTKL